MKSCANEIVRANNIVKFYGKTIAVAGMSFNVCEGEVFCIVGPNGAGKTTTLRMIVGILKPDSGSIKVYGYDSYDLPLHIKRKIAYLPEDAGIPKGLTGIEYLSFLAEVYGVGEKAVERGATLSGLGDALWRRVDEYSKGMKRRLLIAANLAVEPGLLVFDEPTAGLDVSYSLAVRDMIISYVKSTNAGAVISSHNMLEVEYMCDRVALINKGVVVEEGAPREIISKYGVRNLEEVFVKVVGDRQ